MMLDSRHSYFVYVHAVFTDYLYRRVDCLYTRVQLVHESLSLSPWQTLENPEKWTILSMGCGSNLLMYWEDGMLLNLPKHVTWRGLRHFTLYIFAACGSRHF